ncbi:unnamed protein product, partial [Adineta ricciae]
VHVYYDIVTSQECVILTYGTADLCDYPIVRLHMESLLNRFPLRRATCRYRLKTSVKLIIQYGVGIIMLLPKDGRGSDFGSYALEQMLLEGRIVMNSTDARKKIGIRYDTNDYDGTALLLSIHCPTKKIQMIMNTPSSIMRKTDYLSALKDSGFDVKKCLFIEPGGL